MHTTDKCSLKIAVVASILICSIFKTTKIHIKTPWVYIRRCFFLFATVNRISNFLFSLYISFLAFFFLQSCFLDLHKNPFSRKILPGKSLLYYKTKTYCFYLYVKCKVHISRRFFSVRLFS